MKKSIPFLAALLFLLGACQHSEQPVADTTNKQEMQIVRPVSVNESNNKAIVNNEETVVLEGDLAAVNNDEEILVGEGRTNINDDDVLIEEDLVIGENGEVVAEDSLPDPTIAVKENNEIVRKEAQQRTAELNRRKQEALKNAPKDNPAKDRVQALTKGKEAKTTQNNPSVRVDQVEQLSQVMTAVYCNCIEANAKKGTGENCDTKVEAIQKTLFRTVDAEKQAAIQVAYEREVVKCKK